MRRYTKLPIPKDTAWDRTTWRRYTPIWFNKLVDSIENLIESTKTTIRLRSTITRIASLFSLLVKIDQIVLL